MYYAAAPTSAQLAGLRALWAAVAGNIPTGVSLQVENTGQIIDATTGQADDAWSGTAQSAVACNGTGPYSTASGVHFRWNTGTFFNGRAMRGKTYLVPVTTSTFDTDGTIPTATLTFMNNSLNNFLATTAGGLTIYSRRAANAFIVTGAVAIDRQVVMRSRRP